MQILSRTYAWKTISNLGGGAFGGGANLSQNKSDILFTSDGLNIDYNSRGYEWLTTMFETVLHINLEHEERVLSI